jgi:hypothetical protein
MSKLSALEREYRRAWWECPYCDTPLVRMRVDNSDIAWRVLGEHIDGAHPELS